MSLRATVLVLLFLPGPLRMTAPVICATIRGRSRRSKLGVNWICRHSLLYLAMLTSTTVPFPVQNAPGGVVSSAFYTGLHDTKVQDNPEEHIVKSDSQIDIISGEETAVQTGKINLLLQTHDYIAAAASYKSRGSEKLIDMAGRTYHKFTLYGENESFLWWKSESSVRAESTYNDTITLVSQNPLSPQLLTADYYFDLTAYSSQYLDILPDEQPLYRLSDRIRFRASGTGLFGDPIDYDETFYDSDSSNPPTSQYSLLDDDVNFTERMLIPDSDRIQSLTIQLQPMIEEGNVITYSSDLTSDILIDSNHRFLNDGNGLNYFLDGNINLRFTNSAKLLGVLVRDETGEIRTDIDISSAEGVTIPLLSQIPVVVTPAPSNVILSPVVVSEAGLGTFSPDVGLENSINQSGLDSPFLSGVSSFDDYMQGLPQPTADGEFSNYWQSIVSLDGSFDGVLDFDLGGAYFVDRLAIWNGTLEDIEIFVADSPNGPWNSVGSFTLGNQNPLLFPLATPEILDFGGAIAARYIRVQVDSAYPYLSNEAFEYAILREIAVSAAAVPELGSWWLLAIGATCCLCWRY